MIESHPAALRAIDIVLGRGEIARLQGDLATARREFEEALRLDHVNVHATVALSQLALRDGDADQAWNLAMSVVDLYRGFGPAYLARGEPGRPRAERDRARGHRSRARGRRRADRVG
ncbi:MAG: hypothetical protein U1E76_11475 [Planctomycetota bacterium]